jgi:hypothetical protein
MIGPGKYDEEATMVMERVKAGGVILIVIDGKDGGGFAVQATLQTTLMLPSMLRDMADEIEGDLKSGKALGG